MNILLINIFFVEFMVYEIPRVSIFGHCPYSVTFPYYGMITLVCIFYCQLILDSFLTLISNVKTVFLNQVKFFLFNFKKFPKSDISRKIYFYNFYKPKLLVQYFIKSYKYAYISYIYIHVYSISLKYYKICSQVI